MILSTDDLNYIFVLFYLSNVYVLKPYFFLHMKLSAMNSRDPYNLVLIQIYHFVFSLLLSNMFLIARKGRFSRSRNYLSSSISMICRFNLSIIFFNFSISSHNCSRCLNISLGSSYFFHFIFIFLLDHSQIPCYNQKISTF